MSKVNGEDYIKAAEAHGRAGDPDAEVGDLQILFLSALEEMTEGQRAAWAARSEVAAVLEWQPDEEG